MNQRRVSQRLVMALVAAVLMLAACGSDQTDDANIVTVTPRPSPVWAPTWTAEPSQAALPTITLAPTSTSSIIEPTYAPPLVTGARELGDQILVTVRQEDMNEAIARAFNAASITDASNPPEITVEPGYQLEFTMQFTNPFLDETGEVISRATLTYDADQIFVNEIIARRSTSGEEVAYESIWDSLAVIETSINTTVFDILNDQPDTSNLVLFNIQLHYGSHLEFYFMPNPGE